MIMIMIMIIIIIIIIIIIVIVILPASIKSILFTCESSPCSESHRLVLLGESYTVWLLKHNFGKLIWLFTSL